MSVEQVQDGAIKPDQKKRDGLHFNVMVNVNLRVPKTNSELGMLVMTQA